MINFQPIRGREKEEARSGRERTNYQYQKWRRENSVYPLAIKSIIEDYYLWSYIIKFNNLVEIGTPTTIWTIKVHSGRNR